MFRRKALKRSGSKYCRDQTTWAPELGKATSMTMRCLRPSLHILPYSPSFTRARRLTSGSIVKETYREPLQCNGILHQRVQLPTGPISLVQRETSFLHRLSL